MRCICHPVCPTASNAVMGRDAICSTPSDSKRSPGLVTPNEVIYRSLGRLHWRRDVHYIIEPRINSDTLRIGEVVYPPGH